MSRDNQQTTNNNKAEISMTLQSFLRALGAPVQDAEEGGRMERPSRAQIPIYTYFLPRRNNTHLPTLPIHVCLHSELTPLAVALETFELFSQDLPSQNLGFIDPKAATVELTIAGRDLTVHQSPSILSSNRAGGTTGAGAFHQPPAPRY